MFQLQPVSYRSYVATDFSSHGMTISLTLSK